ncbi:hypothetical protein RF11_02426 [Thelohanellus kitauei]|uniref:Uncharacterized protein n=1 Tax=Thelohanellus kitauei TaxID=669202 RepID=A0A0C2MYV2_THEKT|nr:hypothetical protein RF11_02426 [Thelohanellus kitauei]
MFKSSICFHPWQAAKTSCSFISYNLSRRNRFLEKFRLELRFTVLLMRQSIYILMDRTFVEFLIKGNKDLRDGKIGEVYLLIIKFIDILFPGDTKVNLGVVTSFKGDLKALKFEEVWKRIDSNPLLRCIQLPELSHVDKVQQATTVHSETVQETKPAQEAMLVHA